MSRLSGFLDYLKNGLPERITSVSLQNLENGKLLEGRKILITGGDRGCAFSIAQECIKQGAFVTITGTDPDTLDSAGNAIKSNRLFSLLHDTGQYRKAWVLIKKATDLMGGLDSLVHGAFIDKDDSEFTNVLVESWDKQIDTDLKGVYFLTQSFIRSYRKTPQNSGKILLLISDRGLKGDNKPHGLADSALASYTQGMSKKLILGGIRVNALDIPRDLKIPGQQVADVSSFILSEAANCISGSIIPCGYPGK